MSGPAALPAVPRARPLAPAASFAQALLCVWLHEVLVQAVQQEKHMLKSRLA